MTLRIIDQVYSESEDLFEDDPEESEVVMTRGCTLLVQRRGIPYHVMTDETLDGESPKFFLWRLNIALTFHRAENHHDCSVCGKMGKDIAEWFSTFEDLLARVDEELSNWPQIYDSRESNEAYIDRLLNEIWAPGSGLADKIYEALDRHSPLDESLDIARRRYESETDAGKKQALREVLELLEDDEDDEAPGESRLEHILYPGGEYVVRDGVSSARY
jgi:hypothetical protein